MPLVVNNYVVFEMMAIAALVYNSTRLIKKP